MFPEIIFYRIEYEKILRKNRYDSTLKFIEKIRIISYIGKIMIPDLSQRNSGGKAGSYKSRR